MGSEELAKVIHFFGTQQKVGDSIGVSRKVINGWVNKGILVPVSYALSLERLTKGLVLAENLSPHVRSHIVLFKKYYRPVVTAQKD